MPNALEDFAAAARRAAEEKARRERERRRNHLRKQIGEWEGKLNNVTSQITDLEKEKQNLETYLGDWEGQKRKYDGNDVLSEVVIVNVFEGVCADNIRDDFSGCITKMEKTYNGVSRLKDNNDRQIARLNEYRAEILAKLTSLRNELSSI